MLPRQIRRAAMRLRQKYALPGVILILLYILCDQCGLFLYWRALDFATHFEYPLEANIPKLIGELQKSGRPSRPVINPHNYTMLRHAKGKCTDPDGDYHDHVRLVYLVKSAMDHFEIRQAIRATWGFEKRFSDVKIRTVFLLGQRPDPALQSQVKQEAQKYGDLVQGDFLDAYFNNTLKTRMGLRWAMEQCPKSRFYFFVDDDYYVSTRNVLAFLRNPTNYPNYLFDPVVSFDDETFQARQLKQMGEFDIPADAKLWAGFVVQSRPLRQKWSKWFVGLDEYPYSHWPPYITAGAYVLSQAALSDMYYGSFFVQTFRFDDIYLAILGRKLGLEPRHCDEFHLDRKPYTVQSYRYVLASHGFGDAQELRRIWNRQKESGQA